MSNTTLQEATILDQSSLCGTLDRTAQDCRVVQIYPAKLIDGMWKLDHDHWTVGRDVTCDLTITDAAISRRHVRLDRFGEGYRIVDLQSTNGTFVNEKRVSTATLESGDRIRIGRHIFKFLASGCIETRYHETIYGVMTRDALTQAFNKQYLLDSLSHEISRSLRHHRPFSVLMLDIDKFKSVNDTYGHLVGDEVLREFAERVRQVARAGDIFGRFGGEEFAVLACESGLQDALEYGERIRSAVASAPFSCTVGDLTVTVSIGVAEFSNGLTHSADDLLGIADAKLYEAKESGRNRVHG